MKRASTFKHVVIYSSTKPELLILTSLCQEFTECFIAAYTTAYMAKFGVLTVLMYLNRTNLYHLCKAA